MREITWTFSYTIVVRDFEAKRETSMNSSGTIEAATRGIAMKAGYEDLMSHLDLCYGLKPWDIRYANYDLIEQERTS